MSERLIYRYTDAFKEKVLSDLEKGVYRSYTEAAEKNGIRGNMTIKRWIKQLNKDHLLYRVVWRGGGR